MSDAKRIPEPWERQDGEPEDAWLAFRSYRDMPADERLLRRAAAKGAATLSRWYRDFNWYERVRLYDAHFEKLNIEERQKIFQRSAREVAIDHMLILSDARELVQREFAKLLEASRGSEMHGLVKPNELQRLAETMVKLDRLVRGETTENVGLSKLDVSKLSLEEARTLADLIKKAGGGEGGED